MINFHDVITCIKLVPPREKLNDLKGGLSNWSLKILGLIFNFINAPHFFIVRFQVFIGSHNFGIFRRIHVKDLVELVLLLNKCICITHSRMESLG